MSTTVTYKGSTLTTVNNSTRTLKTAGKYMEGDVILTDVTEGSSGGYVWQDENGYVHLSDEGDIIDIESLSVTQNGTYTAPTGKAYSPVTVNVSGGGGGGNKWARPSSWPDLSKMDVSSGDVIYMTSYADEARGFCNILVNCTGSYTVEVGTISGSTFTAESTHTVSSGSRCRLYYGSANGTFKVLRVTGTAITNFKLGGDSAAITIDTFYGCISNNGIIDVVGKLPSCAGMSHSNCYNLINMEIEDISLSGDMINMFSSCYSLTSLDVSSWNTSAVTSMSGMFSSCYSLTSLDVSSWDTSKVTSMSSMFYNCASLTSLDVSNWNTNKVTNMNSMFNGCYSLTSLDVSNWNTSKVTNMGSMFSACSSLILLDVSSWDTSAVTSMSSMFNNCYSLTSLDVSSWNTSKVTSMSSMFYNCASLTSLDVSSWDTSAVTSMSSMFNYCHSLTSLDVSSWNTNKVTNMNSMFSGCQTLTSLDVSSWDFSKVTTASNIGSVFRYCRGLYGSITIPSSITRIGTYFFADTQSLYEYHFLSTTPPTLANTNAFNNMNDFGGKKIYVPSASLTAYQEATNWSTYASYMVGE